MKKPEVVTITQAKQLVKLEYYGYPTVDDVIDWLRRVYNVHIYVAREPFIDPTDENRPVLYRFAVKYCNKRDGWNGRKYVGETKSSPNVFTLKKQAITLALRWIKKNHIKKLSK